MHGEEKGFLQRLLCVFGIDPQPSQLASIRERATEQANADGRSRPQFPAYAFFSPFVVARDLGVPVYGRTKTTFAADIPNSFVPAPRFIRQQGVTKAVEKSENQKKTKTEGHTRYLHSNKQ